MLIVLPPAAVLWVSWHFPNSIQKSVKNRWRHWIWRKYKQISSDFRVHGKTIYFKMLLWHLNTFHITEQECHLKHYYWIYKNNSLRRGVRSDAQLSSTKTRFQKCSQSGENGSKHPMLSISRAFNVISCKKVERNTQKLKIADFTI